MQTTTDVSMLGELADIIARPFHTLATARDLPRLVKHIRLLADDEELFADGSVEEFVRALNDACGKLGQVPESLNEGEGDFVRNYVESLSETQGREAFVMKVVNQNIIAPAVLRLKTALVAIKSGTKDGSWLIEVHLSADGNARVTHLRSETHPKGLFEYVWELTLNYKGAPHSLEVIKVTGDGARPEEVLREAARKANLPLDVIELPLASEYFAPSYFNW